MNEPFAQNPYDPVDKPSKAKSAKSLWLTIGLCVAALAIGLFAGTAIGKVPVAKLESQIAYEKSRVESLVAQGKADKASAEARITAAEESSADKEAELATRMEELETRESEAQELQESLDAEVASREANSFGTGLHEIGVDVKPGKYKTAGPNGNNIAGCYYAWKTSFGSDADIIDNELTKGKATVVLKKGQFFEVGDCQDFVKQ